MQVAQHLVLGVMAVEDRVLEVGRRAAQARRQLEAGRGGQLGDGRLVRRLVAEGAQQRRQVGGGDGLVEGDADALGVEAPQVVTRFGNRVEDLGGAALGMGHRQGVEARSRVEAVTEPGEAGGEGAGEGVHPRGDAAQAVGAVVDGVGAGHDGEQHLGGADIRRRLLAPDVLLAGLHRHAQGVVTVDVLGQADDASRDLPLETVAGGEEGGMGAAEAERHAETLRRADGDVGPLLARRRDQGQGEQVRRHHGHHAGLGGARHELGVVDEDALGVG